MSMENEKPASKIDLVVTPELKHGETPTLPTLLWPGTLEAFTRQCSCPVEENMRRLKEGAPPKLTTTCRVHGKICQAPECGHGKHDTLHERCEHCTNKLILCEVCEAVYMEDGDDPSLHGWTLMENAGQLGQGLALITMWRCRRCSA